MVILIVTQGQSPGTTFTLREGANHIGRGQGEIDLTSQEKLGQLSVSRKHAVIRLRESDLSIEDLGSRWGTVVNRSLVKRGVMHPLKENDLIHVGNVQLRVIFDGDSPSCSAETIR